MRRFTLPIATSIAVLGLLPAAALAGSHVRHQQRRHHHVHHAVVRHERFGVATNPTRSGSGSNSGATSTPSPAENAGTVRSFDAGVLTLALANGSTVSGTVDNGTEIECKMADLNDMRLDGGGGSGRGGGDNGSGRGGDRGSRGGDHGGLGNDNGDRGDDNQNCMVADLVAGAVVRSAELRVSSAGAIWDKVELIG